MWIKEWIPTIRDFTQIAFFAIISIITILTYLKAKRTLLQPIRTEVFKEQLKAFSEIITLLGGKREIELRNDFEFENLLYVNMSALYDQYASHFFEVTIDESGRPYNLEECREVVIPADFIKKEFGVEIMDDHLIREESQSINSKPDPQTKAAIWTKYRYGIIRIPRTLADKRRSFRRAMNSPLLPKPLVALLEDYINTINQNIKLIDKVLTECAAEMPQKYPNIEALKKASFNWIGNRYNQQFIHLENKAKKITNHLRDYFTVDTLLE